MNINDDKEIDQKDENFVSDNFENKDTEEISKKDNIINSNPEEINHDQREEEVEKSTEEKLQENINQLREEKLRLLADMENLRKRTDKERLDSIRYGSINLARDILSPDDNLTRALETIPREEKNSKTVSGLIDGLKMVQKEFSNILEKHGIKKIKTLNMKFDHNLHQAMVEVENDEYEGGTVIQEMQSGYTMHDRLLRPSMVAVSKKSIKNADSDESKDKKP